MSASSFPYLEFARNYALDYATVLRISDHIKVWKDAPIAESFALSTIHIAALERVIALEERRRRMVVFGVVHNIPHDDVVIAVDHLLSGTFPSRPLRAMSVDQRRQLFTAVTTHDPEYTGAFQDTFGEGK